MAPAESWVGVDRWWDGGDFGAALGGHVSGAASSACSEVRPRAVERDQGREL